MGIFDLFKKKPVADRDTFNKYFPDHEAQQQRLKYQSDLLQSVNEANAKYAEDGDIESLIKVYEHAFIESNPPCKSFQNLKLVDLYIKQGLNNKAWAYLNRLITTNEAPIEKIRHEQARILKKEKKYMPATDMIMAEHLLKYSYNRAAFIKDAGVCIRALKWDAAMLEDMADMIEEQLKVNDRNEANLHNTYKKYLQNKGLLDKEV